MISLSKACTLLAQKKIIAVPTESVYGLSVDPRHPDAVEALLTLKNRNIGKGFILVASDFSQLLPWIAPLSPELYAKIEPTWPGPHTWILPAHPKTPDYLTGSRKTLAVRVTAHPVLKALCEQYGSALISTSANPSGEPAPRSFTELQALWGQDWDFPLVEGELGGDLQPTAIWEWKTGRRIR